MQKPLRTINSPMRLKRPRVLPTWSSNFGNWLNEGKFRHGGVESTGFRPPPLFPALFRSAAKKRGTTRSPRRRGLEASEDIESKRFRCLEVDHQFKFVR